MASLKQLRHEVNVCSAQAQHELKRCLALWHGTPGDTLRAAGLISGGFGAGLLVGGGATVPLRTIWQMLVAGVPAVLQELLDAQRAFVANTGA
jgi:hypothetical protein